MTKLSFLGSVCHCLSMKCSGFICKMQINLKLWWVKIFSFTNDFKIDVSICEFFDM